MCRAALPNSAVLDQGGASRRRWPGVSAGLCLGRPARRTPGHTGCDLDQNGSGMMQVFRGVFLALDCPARGYCV